MNKLTSRGKGQEKLTEKLTKSKKTNIMSSIVRRGVKDPKSSTYLYLNANERIYKSMYIKAILLTKILNIYILQL